MLFGEKECEGQVFSDWQTFVTPTHAQDNEVWNHHQSSGNWDLALHILWDSYTVHDASAAWLPPLWRQSPHVLFDVKTNDHKRMHDHVGNRNYESEKCRNVWLTWECLLLCRALSFHSGMPLMRWTSTSVLSTHTRCVMFVLYCGAECVRINCYENFTLILGKLGFFHLN